MMLKHSWYKQQLTPELLFKGFKFDLKDPRYAVPFHALNMPLRDNLQASVPTLKKRLDELFQGSVSENKCSDRKFSIDDTDWLSWPITRVEWFDCSPHGICQKLIEPLNNILLVGRDLGEVQKLIRGYPMADVNFLENNPVNMKAAKRYTWDAVMTSELLWFFPVSYVQNGTFLVCFFP